MNPTILALAVLVAPVVLGAQGIVPTPLKPANGVLKDPVASVSTIRELRDGRVLFPSQSPLSVGNFTDGTIAALSTIPRGKLIALGDDSTLIVSQFVGWVVLVGDKAIGMLPRTNPMVAAATGVFGADATGHVLAITGGQPASDSATVWRVTRLTGSRDSIASLWQGEPAHDNVPAPVFVVSERAVLGLDGWIAVLRAHPYRVDWLTPDGQWVLGKPLPVPVIRMDQREKEAYMADRAIPAGRSPESPTIIANWPETVEPFRSPALFLTPTAEVVVPRTRSADATDSRYDVIDRHGVLVRQLELPANENVLGFGRQSVYVRVSTTPRGGQGRIERHPWP